MVSDAVYHQQREFGTLALACFGLITNASWPYAFFNLSIPLSNGGPAGMLWLTIVSAVGIFLCDISLAELASMTPSSAGPYQWTAEVAPESCQKVLSFVVGRKIRIFLDMNYSLSVRRLLRCAWLASSIGVLCLPYRRKHPRTSFLVRSLICCQEWSFDSFDDCVSSRHCHSCIPFHRCASALLVDYGHSFHMCMALHRHHTRSNGSSSECVGPC